MNDVEQSVRQTLSARVSHLTDERLDGDLPVPTPPRRTLRAVLLPLAAAAAVAAVTVGVVLGVDQNGKPHPAATPTRTAPPPTPTGRQLVGPDWQLESIRLDGRTHPTPRGVDAVISFDDKGQTTGNDGCNGFGGSVAINGQAIRFWNLGRRLPRCTGPAGDVETQFIAALTSIDHWATSDDKLRLTGIDGTVMTFHAR